jgi:uncharacterized protein
MSRMTIIGGTGYAGSAIVNEAVARGHEVTVVSRTAPAHPVPGVVYVQGSALDPDLRARAFHDAEAVISATSPRGDMATQHIELAEALASRAGVSGTRLVMVGGFSSLRPAANAPRFVEGDVPEQFRTEAEASNAVLEMLKAEPAELDWTFVSPAATFGAFAPGEPTGFYRMGGEVAIMDANGESHISAGDFAKAIVDVVDQGTHHREHISVAA